VRVLLDTNVLVSAIFFGGRPGDILEAWVEGRFELIVSPAIYDEYERVCDRLAHNNPSLSYQPLLTLLLGAATLVADSEESSSITSDPDDDKFMRCARDADAVVVSGDSDLQEASGWEGVEVLTPTAFLARLSA
jgi:putative PIN family toxin of toxin-antitoxin system